MGAVSARALPVGLDELRAAIARTARTSRQAPERRPIAEVAPTGVVALDEALADGAVSVKARRFSRLDEATVPSHDFH